MIRQFRVVVAASVAVGIMGASGAANATACSTVISSFNSCSGDAACEALLTGSHPECFGSSSNTAAGAKSVQATSLEQMLVISSAIAGRAGTLSSPSGAMADSGEHKGMAAGNAAGKWNIWASVAESNAKFDRGTYNWNGADRTNRFDNRIQNVVLGGDYPLAPNLVLGLSAAFDDGSGSIYSYNLAAPDGAKSQSSSGYSYAPYLGWQINKDLSLDATIGWGNGDTKVVSDVTVTADSKRFFYGANLNYTKWHGNWQLTGKGGYLFGQEKTDDSKNNGVTTANTKVTNEIGQFRLAGQAAYWMNGVMPYFGLAYTSDDRSSTASAAQQDASAMGKSAWVWSIGANFISIKNAVTGGISYEQESGRDRSKNDKLMANINIRF